MSHGECVFYEVMNRKNLTQSENTQIQGSPMIVRSVLSMRSVDYSDWPRCAFAVRNDLTCIWLWWGWLWKSVMGTEPANRCFSSLL